MKPSIAAKDLAAIFEHRGCVNSRVCARIARVITKYATDASSTREEADRIQSRAAILFNQLLLDLKYDLPGLDPCHFFLYGKC